MVATTPDLAQVELAPAVPPRARVDVEMVKEYAAQMKAGAASPPIAVGGDRQAGQQQTWDGLHRVVAARSVGRERLMANVVPGTREDAGWRSRGANATHGLRRKRRQQTRRDPGAQASKGAGMGERRISQHWGATTRRSMPPARGWRHLAKSDRPGRARPRAPDQPARCAPPASARGPANVAGSTREPAGFGYPDTATASRSPTGGEQRRPGWWPARRGDGVPDAGDGALGARPMVRQRSGCVEEERKEHTSGVMMARRPGPIPTRRSSRPWRLAWVRSTSTRAAGATRGRDPGTEAPRAGRGWAKHRVARAGGAEPDTWPRDQGRDCQVVRGTPGRPHDGWRKQAAACAASPCFVDERHRRAEGKPEPPRPWQPSAWVADRSHPSVDGQ
jgi:hypothetical protein